MDFLKDMKAKLEELEKEAQRQMQEHQQQTQGPLFQPKSKGKRNKAQPQDSYPRGGGPQQAGQRRSHRPIDPDECTDTRRAPQPERVQGQREVGGSIFDNLGGRLEEAFLLQEILGEPRCVRGWDD